MVDQREYWEQRAAAWERRAEVLGGFSDAFGRAGVAALGLQPGERVLEIGCGAGATTVDLAAAVGPTGEVVAVDLAEGMVAAATRRTAGLANVRLVVGDAQVASLGSGFDAAYSRFGVMFFGDPVVAFANIGGALRPGGRLACVVWAELADNPWLSVPRRAAGDPLGVPLDVPAPDQPGPFSMCDPTRTTAVLAGAGFVDVAVARLDGALEISATHAEAEVGAMLGSGPLGAAFESADDRARTAAVTSVIEAIEPFRTDAGWRLPGVALLVTARRPPA